MGMSGSVGDNSHAQQCQRDGCRRVRQSSLFRRARGWFDGLLSRLRRGGGSRAEVAFGGFDRLLGGFEGRLVQGIGGGGAGFIAAAAASETARPVRAPVRANGCTRPPELGGAAARTAP